MSSKISNENKHHKDAQGFTVTDKRFWVEDENREKESSVPDAKYPSYVEELKARTEAAEAKLKDRLRQLEEENASFRKRMESQLQKRLAFEKSKFLEGLLEIVDNLERAVAAADESASVDALRDGIEINLTLFKKKLEEHGVQTIELLHRDFDPNEAEAVGLKEVGDENLDHKVVEVLQQGYKIDEQVLRPAKVYVGRLVKDG